VNPAAKLAGFACALALIGGGSALAGSGIDVHPGRPAADEAAGMAAMGGHDAPAVRGLAVSDRGLTLELDRTSAPRGREFPLRFRIADRSGRTVRDFDAEHTRRMHFIVVRRDLTGFQHLHPVQRPDGSWTARVSLPDAGSYRVFADFAVGGAPHTLAADLAVDGELRSLPLPAPQQSTTVDGLQVGLDAGRELGFTVTRHGRPVPLDDYLGAKGHLVALREGDLAFLHVHPDQRRLRFTAEFPSAGRYRLFLQFKTEGRIHTAAFTREVSR
jgi:hypothetical protein